jgi:hypothetical protein
MAYPVLLPKLVYSRTNFGMNLGLFLIMTIPNLRDGYSEFTPPGFLSNDVTPEFLR